MCWAFFLNSPSLCITVVTLMKRYLLFLSVILSFTACKESTDTSTPPETPPTEERIGIGFEYMDTTISPTENFFLYANGSWLANTEIPPAYSTWGVFE